MTRELSSDPDALGATSAMSFSTSLDESSLDGMPNMRTSSSSSTISDAMANLAAMVTSKFLFLCFTVMRINNNYFAERETEIKTLKYRQNESISQQQALGNQLYQLNERHKKLQKDLLLLKESEKEMESKVFCLWQVPSWFIITDVSTDSVTDCNESTE